MTETTVFKSGNSQAVRLPKEFRFSAKTVEIFRRGDEVVLREKKRTFAEALATLPPISAASRAAFAQAMVQARDRRPPEERSWDVPGPAAVVPAKRRVRK